MPTTNIYDYSHNGIPGSLWDIPVEVTPEDNPDTGEDNENDEKQMIIINDANSESNAVGNSVGGNTDDGSSKNG